MFYVAGNWNYIECFLGHMLDCNESNWMVFSLLLLSCMLMLSLTNRVRYLVAKCPRSMSMSEMLKFCKTDAKMLEY